MPNKLKVGVIGVGALGQWHARIYSEFPDVEFVGVYDTNPERAAEIAAKYHTRAFASLADLAGAAEAVSVVVPTDRHFDVFNQLLPFGLHLLMEKPIASTTDEAERMVAAANARNLVLQVGHVERFNPVLKFLEENLTQPRFIEVIRLAPFPPPRPGGPPRGTEVSVVLDLMIHDLEIILHIVGSPVREIHAVGVPVLSTTEDIANVRLAFENGCVANVTASRISQERMRKIRVFQPDTYVSLDYMNQTGQLCRMTPAGIAAEAVPITKGEPLALELASFVACARDRRDPLVTASHASKALDLAVAICRHIRERPS
ncbi:MAG: Gfo/Idh/MocA family oxidoreductase [Lentisphaerae bacterium]|nr:Gfo/Idh/MocA family oxidoreductase [Lentisphaerota bacterium]